MKISELVRSNIRTLKPYSSARDEFSGAEGVFLDANENPFGVLNRYPDPYQNELKQILAELREVSVSQVFVGNGSDEVIDVLFRAFCEPGHDKALTFTPTYGMYQVSADINNVELIQVPLSDSFEIDLDEFKQRLEKGVKLIFICSPNNPTGNAVSNEVIRTVLNNFDGIVVVDEAYADFNNGDSAIKLVNEYPNLIVSQTMSKAWGLAAARVGFAITSEEVIGYMNKIKPPYNVSALNQKAAIEALRDKDGFNQRLKAILEEKDKLKAALTNLKKVVKIYPSDTNFLLVEFEDANRTYNELVDRKVIVRNRSGYIKNCIRITVGSKEENEILMNALKELEA
ncbi:MAG: histidinol-phosphate transaminase [Crocinitomicaceae bacterium]